MKCRAELALGQYVRLQSRSREDDYGYAEDKFEEKLGRLVLGGRVVGIRCSMGSYRSRSYDGVTYKVAIGDFEDAPVVEFPASRLRRTDPRLLRLADFIRDEVSRALEPTQDPDVPYRVRRKVRGFLEKLLDDVTLDLVQEIQVTVPYRPASNDVHYYFDDYGNVALDDFMNPWYLSPTSAEWEDDGKKY